MQGNTGPGQNNQKPSLSWSQPAVPATPAKATPPAVKVESKASRVAEEKSYTGTYVGIFAGGIIIGALIGWAITGMHSSSGSSMASSTSMIATSTVSGTGTSVGLSGSSVGATVTSPQTAGFAVQVTNVKVSVPTWVVVYEDHASTPGNALGAALFLPQSEGTAQNGTVQLLRATLPGQNYLAGESIDDGDKIFSLLNDKPVHDVQGNQVLVQFSTQ